MIFRSARDGAPSRASGSSVCFPGPGGADRTAELAPVNGDRSEGTHSSTGSLGSTTGMQNRADFRTAQCSRHRFSRQGVTLVPGTLRGSEVRSILHRSEEHTSELQSLMRISYAVFCLKKKNQIRIINICI